MGLAEKLFARHFVDPVDALRRLERNLSSVGLPFDVLERLKELEFPPYPGFDQGMPSFIYYFVSGTGWGTCGRTASSPTSADFVYANDGVGLNLGCPVRLARALELLFRLAEEDRPECMDGLRAPTKHFASVEELLWLAVWRGAGKPRRGGLSQGAGKNVDWFITVEGVPIFLEVKFRPADWPRLTDQGTYRPMDGFLLGKAADQFTKEKTTLSRRLVGVTGFAEPSDLLASICAAELAANNHIHAVLYRTLLGPVHIFTLHEPILQQLMPLFVPVCPDDLPCFYSLPFHWQQRDERVSIRGDRSAQPSKSGSIWYGIVRSSPSRVRLSLPPDPYRIRIVKYLADGEPVFEAVTKYIYPDAC
jgi:hypothetical protein